MTLNQNRKENMKIDLADETFVFFSLFGDLNGLFGEDLLGLNRLFGEQILRLSHFLDQTDPDQNTRKQTRPTIRNRN